MDKKCIYEMRKFMDAVISVERNMNVGIDKKEAELELKDQLYKEFYYVNREMVLFQFYDYLLRALYENVNEIQTIKDFENFTFNIYITRDGENVFARSINSKQYNPEINSEFEISKDAYKRKFYNIELPELEDIRKYYFGDYIHGELKNVLCNALKSKYVSISPNEERYIVGNGFNKSVRELKDFIIYHMEYCEHCVIDGYEQLENYKNARKQKKDPTPVATTRKQDNSICLQR